MFNWRFRISGNGKLRPLFCLAVALMLVSCGTLERPATHKPAAPAPAEAAQETLPETRPTTQPTPLPSATPEPTATPAPTLEPTALPTQPPTATPEPTAAPARSPIDRLVAVRDPAKGAELFATFQEAAGTGYSCSNCHLVDSEKANLGPGLLNIKDRALTRVEGQSAAEYIYESIIDPQAYLVEDFDAELMPQNWSEIYTDLEIFDIVAYLLTLEGRSDINDPDPVVEEIEEEDDGEDD